MFMYEAVQCGYGADVSDVRWRPALGGCGTGMGRQAQEQSSIGGPKKTHSEK